MFSRTLSKSAHDALAVLGKSGLLKQAYLAGGSALALHLGHRRSIDFDFFTEKKFAPAEIESGLRKIGKYEGETQTPKTMLGFFNGVQFSLFDYPHKLITTTKPYLGINFAGIEDIAAMKLVTITDRGTKKDFIDLYALAKDKFSLEHMLGFYDRKYGILEQNQMTLLKGLQYFEDAELSEMPEMLQKIRWEEVKKFFLKETVRLWKKFK